MNRGPNTTPAGAVAGAVVVIGAGPAGCAAAITLRRAGLDVTIIDKAVFPRDKCCGDGLTSGALRLLDELKVDPSAVPTWQPVSDVRVCGPRGRVALLPLPKGGGLFAATAARIDLDAALLDRARAEGATVHEGCGLEALDLYEDRVEVTTNDGNRVVAAWCIAADGMWSPTRKALGLGTPGYRGEWHAFRQYWRNVSPEAARDLFVWFEPDLLPGYFWSFPLPGNRANVGFGVHRRTHRTGDMNELWADLLQRPHIRDVLGGDAEPEAPHRAWPIPARVGELALTAHRTFFVGDAAAACDPMTGEGIGQALQTGIAAARAINAGGQPSIVAAAYEHEVEHDLAVDMRLAGRLAAVLGSRTGAAVALRAASMTDWTSRNFARWLFEDYPRAILATPKRWSRDMFRRPGAYVNPQPADNLPE